MTPRGDYSCQFNCQHPRCCWAAPHRTVLPPRWLTETCESAWHRGRVGFHSPGYVGMHTSIQSEMRFDSVWAM